MRGFFSQVIYYAFAPEGNVCEVHAILFVLLREIHGLSQILMRELDINNAF